MANSDQNYSCEQLAILIDGMERALGNLKNRWENPTKKQQRYLDNYQQQLIQRKELLNEKAKKKKKSKKHLNKVVEAFLNYKSPTLKKYCNERQNTRKKNTTKRRSKGGKQIRQSTSKVCDIKLSWL